MESFLLISALHAMFRVFLSHTKIIFIIQNKKYKHTQNGMGLIVEASIKYHSNLNGRERIFAVQSNFIGQL